MPTHQHVTPRSGFAVDGKLALSVMIRHAYRWLVAAAWTGMEARGTHPLTVPQLEVFNHVDVDGISIAELARRSGIARQSSHQSVNELVAIGILRVDPDPSSGRSKLVRPTEMAEALIRSGKESMTDSERWLATRMGRETFDRLYELLNADWGPPPEVDDWNPLPGCSDPAADAVDFRHIAPRTQYAVGDRPFLTMLARHAYRWFFASMAAGFAARDVRSLTITQLEVFSHLDPDGISIAELARRSGVARQSAHQAVNELVTAGLLRIDPDPNSRRSKLVRSAENADEQIQLAQRIALESERILAARIGADKVALIREILADDWGPPPELAELRKPTAD